MSYVSYLSSSNIQNLALLKPRVSWSILMKTLVGFESCCASMVVLLSASSDYNPDADITCKVNRFKQIKSSVSPLASLDQGFLVGLPADPSTWRNFPDTGYYNCPVEYIFFNVFIQRSFNKIKTLDTSLMEVIEKRLECIVLSNGVTQKSNVDGHTSLESSFCFNIGGWILRRHAVSRLIMRIYPKILRSILSMIVRGGVPNNQPSYHLPIA